MMRFKLLFSFFFFIALPLSTIAQEDTIDLIFEASTIPQILEETPKDLQQQFSQNPFGISSENNERLIELFLENFSADSLSATAKSHLTDNFNQDLAASTLEQLQSEPIKSVLETESDFYTIQGTRKQIITKYELEEDEPSQERIDLIRELIEQRSDIETEIESQTILFRTFVLGTDTISSQLALGDEQVEAIIDNFKNRMQMQLEDELIQNYLVMYHSITDEQLKEYASFYETEAGQEYKTAVAEAVHAAFEEGSDQYLYSVESR